MEIPKVYPRLHNKNICFSYWPCLGVLFLWKSPTIQKNKDATLLQPDACKRS